MVETSSLRVFKVFVLDSRTAMLFSKKKFFFGQIFLVLFREWIQRSCFFSAWHSSTLFRRSCTDTKQVSLFASFFPPRLTFVCTAIISSALQFIIKDFGLENDSFKQGLAVRYTLFVVPVYTVYVLKNQKE